MSDKLSKDLRIGFVGAGRVGFTLGRYFAEKGFKLSGYYSKTKEHSLEASKFTNSICYEELNELITASDIVFITVTDSQIEKIWKECSTNVAGKILCHCSGALSSAVFSGIEEAGGAGFSVHPIFAISDKLNSYKEISKAYFTIEGSADKLEIVKDIFARLGNPITVIDAQNKSKYHAAAVFASNLVIGLFNMSTDILCDCGFTKEAANEALMPLFIGNAKKLSDVGCKEALTGPVDRGDKETILKHISSLSGDSGEVYKLLTRELIKIAGEKYPERERLEI